MSASSSSSASINPPVTSQNQFSRVESLENQYFEFGEENQDQNLRLSVISGVEGPGVLDIAGCDDGEEPGNNELHNDSSSVIKFYPEWCRCLECLRQDGYSPNATWKDHCRNSLLCPPQGPTSRIIAFVLAFILGMLLLWILLGNVVPGSKSPASPEGPIFAIGILELVGLFTAIIMKLIRLPSLLGPLLLGIFIRNVEAINLFRNLEGYNTRNCGPNELECKLTATNYSNNWIKPIREIALTMILTRAGLEMSPKQLRKLKGVVPFLAFGPCIIEACACALFTWIFFNVLGEGSFIPISVPMCFVSGFALAAVSPAVVVPGMVSLKKKNLGVAQGIPTLLIAASSIDDVLAISAYTIFLGIAITQEAGNDKDASNWEHYAGGPISIVLGIFHGLIVGIFLHFIPSRDNKTKTQGRIVLLLLFNLLAIFAYDLSELLSGAGPVCCLVTSFIASFGWRSQAHWKKPMKIIEKTLSRLWTLVVPLLFGTIGREIDFGAPGFTANRVGKILAIIVISLLIRCFTAFMIAGGANLNLKERLFCAMAWVPKATVQAALAPLVLVRIQEVIKRNGITDKNIANSLIAHGEIVVTTAVIAILITAPLGAILIAVFAPILLRSPTVPELQILIEEFPNGDGVDPAMESEAVTPVTSKAMQLFMYNENKERQPSITSLPPTPAISSVIPREVVSADAILEGHGEIPGESRARQSVEAGSDPSPESGAKQSADSEARKNVGESRGRQGIEWGPSNF